MDEKQKYFDDIGDNWDKDLTAEDLERLTHIIDTFHLREGSKVCDLGCGTGVLFDMLRRRVGRSGFIVGVDFAPRVAHKAA
ncbi:MAG: methyltransferase domain-containing protein, partial [candidate division Zixibacteria bacterium]|nr:methyltransferase domain-containing protein [candidate division Zixibacteria bacterium]